MSDEAFQHYRDRERIKRDLYTLLDMLQDDHLARMLVRTIVEDAQGRKS